MIPLPHRLPTGALQCRRWANTVRSMDDTALLSLAMDLAEKAGQQILSVRRAGFEIVAKDDASPVTAADHAAEAVIVAGLREATPDIPVIAEEEMAAGLVVEPGRSYWLVDPLDGTREFAAGRDEFAVNIGLVRDHRAVLGAVGIPAYGEIFGGILGRGAIKRTQEGDRPVQARAAPAGGLVVMASRHTKPDARMEVFLAERHVAEIIRIGSAVKFCRLAEGAADLYPRFGRTMEWDTAAPQAVLEAAGGHVLLTDGTTLRYGKPGWENPSFFCTGR